MSLTRYENEDIIVQLTQPQYGQLFLQEDLDILPHSYLIPDDVTFVNSNVSQVHIYSFYGNYIAGDHNASYLVRDPSTNSLLMDLGETFKEADISRGSYIVVMNVFKQVWGNPDSPTVFIREISPDRTEVKLSVPSSLQGEMGEFNNNIESFKSQGIFNNLVIDFGFNRVSKILLAKFDPNDSSVIYLKLYKPLNDEVGEKVTGWFGFETMNPYVDTVILTSPIEAGVTNVLRCANYDLDTSEWTSNATVLKSWNDLLDSDAPTTQRILDTTVSGSASARLNIDYTDFNNFIFYSSAAERLKNFRYKVGLIEGYTDTINTLGTTLVSSSNLVSNGDFSGGTGDDWDYTTSPIILFGDGYAKNEIMAAGGTDHIGEMSQSISTNVGDDYTIYFTRDYNSISADDADGQLNLYINGVQKHSSSTTSTTAAALSASFTGSGTDEVKFELGILGSGNPAMWGGVIIVDNISVAGQIFYSGSLALYTSASITTNQNRIDTVVSNFDSFERWMYHDGTGSIFTHDVTGSVTPYPKYLSGGQYVRHHSTSSIATSWYNGLVATASSYDEQNHNRLWWSIPEHVTCDEGNSDYILFVEMVGQHFDNLYAYTKALTQIHERDEHPERGVSNDLLYHVAKSFGWKLQNTRQLSDLWFYKLGTNSSGEYENTGSMFSLSRENQTQQIWRRIVNNLPYLLKTKGTTRSVKALMSIYGIPQTLISIKEYGGASQGGNKPQAIEDHFGYALNFEGNQRVTMKRVEAYIPETIMFRFNTDYSGSSPMSVLNIDDVDNKHRHFDVKLHHALELTGTGSYSGSYTYGQLEMTLIDSGTAAYFSGSTGFLPLYDGDMWTVSIYSDNINTGSHSGIYTMKVARATDCTDGTYIVSSSAVISGVSSEVFDYWISDAATGNVNLGGYREFVPSEVNTIATASYFSGSIHGYKEYTTALSTETFDEHVLNPLAYHTDTSTGSYSQLYRYFPLGLDVIRYDHDTVLYVSSSHPNQDATTYTSASFIDFTGSQSDQYRSFRETHYRYTPNIGANNVRNNKLRIEDSSLTRDLSPTGRGEKSQFDQASNDTNRLAIVYSMADQVNRDIYNHMGFDALDQWIGDPEFECATEYSELKRFSNEYFKKYQQKNDINAFIRILSVYDYSFFEQIKQLVPARADLIAGILIEPSILERSKVCISKPPVVTNPQWEKTIRVADKEMSGVYQNLEASASLEPDFMMEEQVYVTASISGIEEFTVDYCYYTGSIPDPVELSGSSIHHTEIGHQKTGICGVVDVYRNRYSGSQSHTQSIVDTARDNCKYVKKVCYYEAYTGFNPLVNDPYCADSSSWTITGSAGVTFTTLRSSYTSSYIHDLNTAPYQNYISVDSGSNVSIDTTKPISSGSTYIARFKLGVNVTETETNTSNIIEVTIDGSTVAVNYNTLGRFADVGVDTIIGAHPVTTSGSAYHTRVTELEFTGTGNISTIVYAGISTISTRVYSLEIFPKYNKWERGWLAIQNECINLPEYCVNVSSSYQIDECGSRNNSRYLGTKMSSAGFNVDSPDTIDGGPVVTITETNPNSLFIKDDGDDGNLLVE